MLRVCHQSPLLVATLLLFAVGLPPLVTSDTLFADDSSRSEAQTAGEKRLLDWDLKKSYDLSRKEPSPFALLFHTDIPPRGLPNKGVFHRCLRFARILDSRGKKPVKTVLHQAGFSGDLTGARQILPSRKRSVGSPQGGPDVCNKGIKLPQGICRSGTPLSRPGSRA
jgi:hypothetical protein